MGADKHGSGPSKMAICSEIFLSVASGGKTFEGAIEGAWSVFASIKM